MPVTLDSDQENSEGVFIDFEKFIELCQTNSLPSLQKCQDLKSNFPELFARNYKAYQERIFFTHRWDDKDNPDIRNWQYDAIYQYGRELQETNRLPACFWYDYCSLPQEPCSSSERSQFKEGLKHIDLLCRTCINVPLISKLGSSKTKSIELMLKRGWILVELFISNYHELIHYPMFEGAFDYVSDGKVSRLDWSSLIPNLMNTLPFDNPEYIRKWFDVNDIACKNGSDLDILSIHLYEHIYSYVRNEVVSTPLRLKNDIPTTMSPDEIRKYCINKYGISALFSDTYFDFTYDEESRLYTVIARHRPPFPCIDKWERKTKREIDAFRIDNKSNISPMYQGVVFEIKKKSSRYYIKAILTSSNGNI